MSEKRIQLSDMIQTLRNELAEARINSSSAEIKFEAVSVDIEVNVEITQEKKGGGGIKFWVINAGAEAKYGNALTHKFKLSLKPKSTATGKSIDVSDKSDESISNS